MSAHPHHALTLGSFSVRQHDGLFSLNDLHRAAGGEKRHQPSDFLRTDQAQALLAEIQSADSRTAVQSVNGGPLRGTYACRELVIAYAAWISAAFHLKVIRVFLSSQPALPDAQRLALATAAAQALAVAAVAQPQAGRFVVDLHSGNVAPVAPGVQFTTWAELAQTVAEHGAFIASADLARLAAACTTRLAQRLEVRA